MRTTVSSSRGSRLRLILVAIGACCLFAGCATLATGDTAAQAGGQVATIVGDPRFNAGLPVIVVLRKVDEQVVDGRYSRVTVTPGRHRLLVDCQVAEPRSVARFTIDEEFEAGGHYRLRAEAAGGDRGCTRVYLD
jgi:hypothetical protein